MKAYLFAVSAVWVIASCAPGEKKQDDTQADSLATTAEAPAAQLTAAQKAEGWKLLFDGQTLDGWKTFKDEENDSWEVKDGAIHCKPKEEAEKRADLMTVDQYENFEFAFEWKISKGGNSGVMFHVTEEYDRPYHTGPEYQVLDDGGYPGEVKETNMTAGNYDMHAPQNKTLNPPGEWNTSKIIVNGPHVEHWLNGTKVVEYEIGSDDWKQRKEGSKWKDVTGYGVPAKGHIDLQDHDHEVWYRNLMIREL